jgi:hypothetical protein
MPADATHRAAPRKKLFAGAIALFLLCVVIGGCSRTDSPDARFDDYLDRLARTLDRDLPTQTSATRQSYPARRELLQAVEVPRTGWIGFFQLHRCGLVNLVSERNSILGRVAPPQARLAYESQLLAGLVRCRRRVRSTAGDDDDFIARLDELIALKQAALGATLWNQSLASRPMTHLFSVAGHDAGLEPDLAGQASRQALARLADRLGAIRAGEPVAETALVTAYETLDKSEYGGAIQIAAIQASAALRRATTMLDARLADRPICFNKQPNRRARVLRTILLDIYGQRIQPYLAELVRAGRRWRAAVDELLAVQVIEPPPVFSRYYRRTLAANSGVWAELDTAIAAHTDSWQTALGQCDLMPGG